MLSTVVLRKKKQKITTTTNENTLARFSFAFVFGITDTVASNIIICQNDNRKRTGVAAGGRDTRETIVINNAVVESTVHAKERGFS